MGRLDKETEGLLLLTNDGDLAHRLTSPRHHVQKIYYARHEGTASPEDVQAFSEGLLLRDGTLCRPAELKPLGPGESRIQHWQRESTIRCVRMMASRHMTVTYLKRIQIGSLTLGELPCGACRELTRKELEDLT